MLLIGPHRVARSQRPDAVGRPFVYERLGRNESAIRAFLAALPDSVWLTRALRDELHRRVGAVRPGQIFADDLFPAAAHAIAAGTIQVGSLVPDQLKIRFDPGTVTAADRYAAVVFPGIPQTEAFLRRLLMWQASMEAFQAALIGGQRLLRGSIGLVPAWNDSDPAQSLAPLLTSHRLLLVRQKPLHQLVRPDLTKDWSVTLRWLETHRPEIVIPITPAAPPPAAAAPASTDTAPASVLPDPPATLSPQAQTLIQAARDGTPFCEECARAAAHAG